jgi:hypothetical protein
MDVNSLGHGGAELETEKMNLMTTIAQPNGGLQKHSLGATSQIPSLVR